MLKKMQTKLIKFKVPLICLVSIVVLLNLLISRYTVDESFTTFDLSSKEELSEKVTAKIVVTKTFPFSKSKRTFNLEIQVDGRGYGHHLSHYSNGPKDNIIPIGNPYVYFGVILHNSNFSKFVVLFDDQHNARANGVSQFFTFPQMEKAEAFELLDQLLTSSGYLDSGWLSMMPLK